MGFVPLETDSCIYTRGNILLSVYVDDIKVVRQTKEDCEAVYYQLEKLVKVENKGPIKSFLGIDVIRDWDKHLIAINQSAYIDRLVGEFGLTTAHSVRSPLDPTLPLLTAQVGDRMCNAKYY